MVTTNDNGDGKAQEVENVTTHYTIRSRESLQRSSWKPLVVVAVTVPVLAVALTSSRIEILEIIQLYWNDKSDNATVISIVTALIGVFLAHRLVFASSTTKTVDVSLSILPLGVQRSRITTYNSKSNVHHYPFLPIERVKDCILLEHVGAFSVSTHVMLRIGNTRDKKPTGMVAAFPDTNLTFDQCHGLVQQIKRALEQVQ